MKFTGLWSLAAGIVTVVLATGCNLFSDDTQVELKARAPRSLGQKAKVPGPRKLHPFVACLNTASVKVGTAREHYTAWAERDPFSCKGSKGIPRIWLLPTNICLEQMKREARNLPHDDRLLKATGNYVASFLKLSRLSDRLSQYYDKGDNRQDKCKLGEKLHQPLMDAFTNFTKADRTVREIVDRESIQRKQRLLDDHERKFGKTQYFYARKLMLDAKILMQTLDQEIVRKRVRTENLMKATEELRKSYTGFSKPGTTTDSGPQVENAKEFSETVNRFYRKTKRLEKVKRWKANPKAQKYYQELVREYNFLVEQSNHLRVSDPQ